MFTILKKDTKQFFAGFNTNGDALWVSDIDQAKPMERFAARNQASLFRCLNINVQNKPVRIGA
jgi:hypothetical protein